MGKKSERQKNSSIIEVKFCVNNLVNLCPMGRENEVLDEKRVRSNGARNRWNSFEKKKTVKAVGF